MENTPYLYETLLRVLGNMHIGLTCAIPKLSPG